ncbi:hypothetical protein SK128_001730 [Halocaridina rubra]|uniref:Uncharacterized protein n=1 Tax=Halocaridina rubra TaxID=373956 RepID=A0AAN8XRY0_HALRR
MRRESQQVESAISHGEEVRNALVLVRNIVEGAESLDDMKVALERSRELESRSVRWLDDNLDTFPLCTTPPSIAKWLVAGTSNGVYAEHIIDGVTRHSKISWDGEKLLIHASRIDSPHPDAFILEFERVKCLAERSRYIVFLDLAWSGANPTRVCIEVDGESGRGERFVTLCTGERGPSYLGMGFNIGTADKGTLTSQKFREVPDGKLADMIIETRQCMKSVEIGMVGSGDIWQCDYTFNSVRQSEGTISQFCIYLQEHLIPVNTIFGSVVSGLRGVILAAAHYPISEVKILDCGIIIPMKRKNISTHDDL